MSDKCAVTFSDSVLSLTSCTPSRVLLTVPHDGARNMQLEPFIPRRTRGVTRRDVGTWAISRDIAELCPVNVVRGLVPRMHIDYNRSAAEAYEAHQFAATYSAYHGLIYEHVRRMSAAFGLENLLVLDVHNFPNQPTYASRGTNYDLILGTKYCTTMLYGEPDLEFAKFMEARGYSVYVPETVPARVNREDWFNGGFTVCNVAEKLRVNALQIEICAAKFCTRNSAVAGTRLAADIADFLREYYGR